MGKLLLVAFFAFDLAGAQVASTPPSIEPSVDSPAQRQSLQRLLACVAQARPRWARDTLAQPYLSDAQASAATQLAAGRDTCLSGAQAEVTFRTSSIVSGLAEHFLRSEIQRANFAQVARALTTMPPRNVSEDFAFCVASRNPLAARELALSEFGSESELRAARQLAAHVPGCTNPGENLTVDLQALRALSSTALYRGVATVLARN